MIIKDVNGGKLSLTKTILKEVTGFICNPYFLDLADLKKTKGEEGLVRIRAVPVEIRVLFPRGMKVEFTPSKYEIGCRTFSPETFAQILKAAGVKTAKARKKSKRK